MNFRQFLVLLQALRDPRSRALLDFHEAQIRYLMAHFPKRPIPTITDKVSMSRAAVEVGRKALGNALTLFTPETLLKWHRDLVRRKWDYSRRRGPGRPGVLLEIEKLILQWAEQNPTWGYKHLRDALRNVGHIVSRSTIQNILKKHGIQPAPQRQKSMSWSDFLRIHKDALVGMDFFNWEVLTPFGLATHYVLFLIQQATREVHIAGITTNPGTEFMKQVARNLTMPDWGWLKRGRIVLHDRAGQFCPAFRHILQSEGIRTIQLPFQSPNLNAYAERWVRSVKEECLSRMIVMGEPMLRSVLSEYVRYFQAERNHQGLGGAIPFPGPELGSVKTRAGPIRRRQRLGGLLNYYYRECA